MKRLHVHVSVEDLPRSIDTDYGDGTGENQARVAREKPEQQSACCAPQVAPATSRACC
ncbi:hypothetical protein [Bradyrhizobium guangxiense]|uniref:hypothetical protein n=1 Tax=Bradyrhizobium guangxiense TaxID=1325115 RepID=UPI001FE14102|nr:hypothetical protein [Bradyrhizobium guangxiense]